MTSERQWAALREAFSAELEERIRTLNHLLLRLERDDGGAETRAEALDALFREAHSLKGAARAVELAQVEALAHALESALETARRGDVVPEGAWFDNVYKALDGLLPLYRAATDGDLDGAPDVAALISALQPSADAAVMPVPDRAAVQVPAAARDTRETPPGPVPEVQVSRGGAPARSGVESIRVAVDKLDVLLAQAGELAVANIRVEQRLRGVLELRWELEERRRDWRSTRGPRVRLSRILEQGGSVEAALRHDIEALLRFSHRAEMRVQQLADRMEEIVRDLQNDSAQLGIITRTIEDEVMAIRLLPVTTLFTPFERMVRDLTREQGKAVALVTEGGETEIDRKILEQLKDPVMHLLRNAIDHGVETPEERRVAGKAAAATVRLVARQRGGSVEIEVSDDGRGLDPEMLRKLAVRRGLLAPERAATLDDEAARDLIFVPGFSSSSVVTETSGRGVGMDVVRENVGRLQGQVRVSSVTGQGTRFILSVPLSLATTSVVLVEQGSRLYAIPSTLVELSGRVRAVDLVSIEGRRTVAIAGHPVPILELADVLELGEPGSSADPAWRHYFVLRQAERTVALLTDRLVGEQEIVVKPLGWPLRRVRNVAGAAVLSSGRTVILLNPADMLRSAAKLLGRAHSITPAAIAARERPAPRRLLVVDDSLTTRTLLRSILEAAGYRTVVAGDGAEALALLRQEPADLVVSDVDMPRLDGFSLTAEIRRDPQLRMLPVILVTSRDSPEHRRRGAEAGADAYIVKTGFDQAQLLEAIGRLLA